MLGVSARLLFAGVLLGVWSGGSAAADAPLKGVALVVGQSAYSSLPVLANPPKDATAIAGLLDRLGFEVTTSLDDDRADLVRALADFEAVAKDADVALIYYSGHGIEAGGQNYLVPTDADLSTPQRAGETLVPVAELLDALAKNTPVTIVLLDACRSDAFPGGTMIQPVGASAPVPAVNAGLGELRGPTPLVKPGVAPDSLGMVIGFAAAPGQPALDGAPGAPNSPYAAALLKQLGAGGYSFGDVMTLVSEEVYLTTKGRQLPWVNSSLRRVLTFGKAVEPATGDEASIRTGRRDLLLSIATTPRDLQATAETVAATTDVPLAGVYAMLAALGVDTSDPTALEEQLEQGAERIKRLSAGEGGVATADTELASLQKLAQEATAEGALPQALGFWDRAVARAEAAPDAFGGDSDKQHKAVAAVYAGAGDAAMMALDFRKAADRFHAASNAVADLDAGLSANYKKRQAEALTSLGEFGGETDTLLEALNLYDEVMTYLDDQSDDDAWADTYNEFGYALSVYGDRQEDNEYLEDAEHAFTQVAGIWTKDTRPADWARLQNNLGNIYASLGDRSGDPQRWQQARSAYQAALDVWTVDANPIDWARAQNNLGTVQRSLGNYGKDAGELGRAVKAYRAALRRWTRATAPYDYAVAQNNLGNALTDLAKYADADANYADGLAAYDAALDVWNKERQPLQWAAVLNNIGATYASMGRSESGTESLERAVDAYARCLTARTKDNDPRNWALTEYNLGLVLNDLGARSNNADAWTQAVAAFTASLEVYDQDNSPGDWADTQEGLGWAEAHLGALTGNRAMVEAGRAAMENAYNYYGDQNGADEYYRDKLAAIDKLLKSVS